MVMKNMHAGVPSTTGAVAKREGMSPAEAAPHAQAEKETLVEAGEELKTAQFDVDSAKPKESPGAGHGEGHPQKPVFAPANPWPAADNGKLPFKGLK